MATSSLKIILETIKKGAGEKDVKKGLDGIVGSLLTIGTAAAVFGTLVSFTKQAIAAAADAEKAEAQVAAALNSTGGAAGMTMLDIKGYSSTLQDLSGVEDDYFMKMSAVMLTFTRITKDSFLEATTAALDMSTALGTDMQQSVIMVGKALNVAAGDVNGASMAMSAMKRVGVAFTTDQIDLAKKLIATGDAAGYQKLILKELNTEFGGSAAAQLDTYAGRVVALKTAWGNTSEAIGSYITQNDLLNETIDKSIDYINDVNEGFNLYMRAQKAGIEITGNFFSANRFINGVLVEQEDILRIVEQAEWDLAAATDAGVRALDHMPEALDEVATAAENAEDKIGEINSVLDYSEDAFNRHTVAAALAKAALDGFVDPSEEEYIYGLATSLGVLTKSEIAAGLKAIEFRTIMTDLMDLPASVQKKFILNVEVFGLEAAIALIKGMGENPPEKNKKWDEEKQEWRAKGGPLGPVTKVGEEGFEYIVNGMVIPHRESVWLERAGIFASEGRAGGGPVTSESPVITHTSFPPKYSGQSTTQANVQVLQSNDDKLLAAINDLPYAIARAVRTETQANWNG